MRIERCYHRTQLRPVVLLTMQMLVGLTPTATICEERIGRVPAVDDSVMYRAPRKPQPDDLLLIPHSCTTPSTTVYDVSELPWARVNYTNTHCQALAHRSFYIVKSPRHLNYMEWWQTHLQERTNIVFCSRWDQCSTFGVQFVQNFHSRLEIPKSQIHV